MLKSALHVACVCVFGMLNSGRNRFPLCCVSVSPSRRRYNQAYKGGRLGVGTLILHTRPHPHTAGSSQDVATYVGVLVVDVWLMVAQDDDGAAAHAPSSCDRSARRRVCDVRLSDFN